MGRNWTFGQKIGAGFAAVVLLTLAMGVVSYSALRRVVDEKDRVIRYIGQDLIDAEVMRAAMQKEVASLRGFLLTGEERFAEGVRIANQEFSGALGRIEERGLTPRGRELIDSITAAEREHQATVDQILAQRRTEAELAELVGGFDTTFIPRFDSLTQRVGDFVVHMERERETSRQDASDLASRASLTIAFVGLVILVLATLISLFLTRSLSRQIGASVQRIRSSSAELQGAASQQASGAKEQATAMNEITTTIGELLTTSRQIADSGQHVARIASDTARSARTGEEAVDKAQEAVDSIRQQVDMIVQHMLDLGKMSQQIGGILEIINELAEQTNILAINATIEASGAGESGRRFAVVGEEIRKLADRVGGSTKEIRTLIEEMRAAVNSTVMATETGSKTVDEGARRFEDLQTAFANIGELVGSTTEAGREIELSTKQQTTAVEQVNVAISNVAQATKETEASSGQTLETASRLAALSDDLARLVQPAEQEGDVRHRGEVSGRG